MAKILTLALLFFGLFVCSVPVCRAQTTEFAYQGSLKDGANPANGNYDFEFRLYDAVSGGNQVGLTVVVRNNVVVTSGIFSATLDFGVGPIPSFPGADRFLDVRVRVTGGGVFTPLAPRNKVGSSPYALQSLNATNATTATNATNATTATNSTQLGGVAANQYVLTGDARLSDARNPLPGSTNYIRNSGAQQQAGASFWISGSGNFGGAGNFDSGLSVGGNFIVGGNTTLTGNLTVNGTLTANLPSGDLSYVQNRTTAQLGTTNFNINGSGTIGGTLNATTVSGNIFSAVTVNSSVYNIGGNRVLSNFGTQNIAVGVNSGANGADNSFFGFNAGNGIQAGGTDNSFFGSDAGGINTTGSENSFFGSDTGDSNTTGFNNSFFGRSAGGGNTSGDDNSFFGRSAGAANVSGNNNTLIGTNADVYSSDLSFATAIGAGAVATSSNQIQLGRNNGSDDVRISGNLRLVTLAEGGSTDLCRNLIGSVVSTCASSLRYKSDVQIFTGGLDIVSRLRPITFIWNGNGVRDVGFGAEEVEKIEPLLTTYNDKGEIEGVKYKQITTVLVNAVKEQQAQIEAQQTQIEQQKKQIESLTKIVCGINSKADICKTSRSASVMELLRTK